MPMTVDELPFERLSPEEWLEGMATFQRMLGHGLLPEQPTPLSLRSNAESGASLVSPSGNGKKKCLFTLDVLKLILRAEEYDVASIAFRDQDHVVEVARVGKDSTEVNRRICRDHFRTYQEAKDAIHIYEDNGGVVISHFHGGCSSDGPVKVRLDPEHLERWKEIPIYADVTSNLVSLGKCFVYGSSGRPSVVDAQQGRYLLDEALKHTPDDHPHLWDRLLVYLDVVGGLMVGQISEEDSMQVIRLCERLEDLAPHGHPGLWAFWNLAYMVLESHFQRTGSSAYAEKALNLGLKVTERLAKYMPPHHKLTTQYILQLGALFSKWYRHSGSALSESSARIGLRIFGLGSNHAPTSSLFSRNFLKIIASFLIRRRVLDDGLFSSYQDLDLDLEMVTKSLNESSDPSDRAFLAGIRAGYHIQRWTIRGSDGDLRQALCLSLLSVQQIPENDASRICFLKELAVIRMLHWKRFRDPRDVDEAMEIMTNIMKSVTPDHEAFPTFLSVLADVYGCRFVEAGVPGDLDRQINLLLQAGEARADNRKALKGVLSLPSTITYNLSIAYGKRYLMTSSVEDLNASIKFGKAAVEEWPSNHYLMASILSNLGTQHSELSKLSNLDADLDEALSAFTRSWKCQGPTWARTRSAGAISDIHAGRGRWDESGQVMQEAVELFPTISPRSLSHVDTHAILSRMEFSEFAPKAASCLIAAGRPPEAVLNALEVCRGVLASLIMDMRVDLSALRACSYDLAERFANLGQRLDSPYRYGPDLRLPKASPESIELIREYQEQSRETEEEFESLLLRIRSEPGFGNFLCPPGPSELRLAAESGPVVVINVSRWRCDALLIETERIRTLPLPELSLPEVEKRVSEFSPSPPMAPLLEWLWDAVCRPCLDELGFRDVVCHGQPWPRVWWIPTGPLSRMPLHAAGRRRNGKSAGDTVMDRVVSSYATSVRALLHARRAKLAESTSRDKNKFVMIGMPETPGHAPLHGVNQEISMLKSICQELQLRPVKPVPSKQEVLGSLEGCRIFHFAGHGDSDAEEPSRSRLLLRDCEDDPLTLADLRECRFLERRPFLAYLSACSTGTAQEKHGYDESVHLCSAFQLAGFRHVVGTLWNVNDRCCVEISRGVYETLRDSQADGRGMTDGAVGLGLHLALRKLRDGVREDKGERDAKLVGTSTRKMGNTWQDTAWIPFVHYGP